MNLLICLIWLKLKRRTDLRKTELKTFTCCFEKFNPADFNHSVQAESMKITVTNMEILILNKKNNPGKHATEVLHTYPSIDDGELLKDSLAEP